MAEATIETTIDLSNIAELVTADKIAELTEHRNCLIHGMDSLDIMRIVWELVSKLPMMNMHRMYPTEEIFKIATPHLQALGKSVLTPLKDGKQKMVLCPVYLPLKRAFPGKRTTLSREEQYMEALRTAEAVNEIGAVERLILVDRDSCFYELNGYWEPQVARKIENGFGFAASRQLRGVALKKIADAVELHRSIGQGNEVRFFWLASQFLEEMLTTTLQAVRREYEKSVGVSGRGDAKKLETYLAIVQGNNLFWSVYKQLYHRYGMNEF